LRIFQTSWRARHLRKPLKRRSRKLKLPKPHGWKPHAQKVSRFQNLGIVLLSIRFRRTRYSGARIKFSDPAEKNQHDEIVARVEEMLELRKEYAAAREKFADKMDTLKRRIDAVDTAIGAMVYRLYDLSAEEIRVVEGREKTFQVFGNLEGLRYAISGIGIGVPVAWLYNTSGSRSTSLGHTSVPISGSTRT